MGRAGDLNREFGKAICPVCQEKMNAPFPLRNHLNQHVKNSDITETRRVEIIIGKEWRVDEGPLAVH